MSDSERKFFYLLLTGITLFLLNRCPASEPFVLLDEAPAHPIDVTASPLDKLDEWLTVAGNFSADYRDTNFVVKGHDTFLFQGDTRLELWLPPYRSTFSYGFYIRGAGIGERPEPGIRECLTRGSWVWRSSVSLQPRILSHQS